MLLYWLVKTLLVQVEHFGNVVLYILIVPLHKVSGKALLLSPVI